MDYYSVKRISNSYLSTLKRQINGLPDTRNKETLAFGNGFHCLLLEPDKFDARRYLGREIKQMMDMAMAVKNGVDPQYLQGEKEKEYYYDFLDLPCKLKADIVNTNKRRIVDIKTTAATTQADFIKQAIEFDYIRQSAWYLDCPLADADEFIIIGVCKTRPYPVFFWQMTKDDPFIQTGREEYLFLVDYIKNSEELRKQFEIITNVESKIIM